MKIFLNARRWLPNATLAPSGAIVTDRGKILAIENNDEALKRYGKNAEIVDLQQAIVLPAAIDAHVHTTGMGERLLRPRLEGLDKPEIFQRLRALLSDDSINDRIATSWIVARGWDQNLWSTKTFPDKADLDREVSSDHPIALTRVDGHALWVNSKALQIAGITSTTNDPRGGAVVKDSNGKPTGILIDEAMGLVERCIPRLDRQGRIELLKAGLSHFASNGLAAIHDMGIDIHQWEAYKALYSKEGHSLPRSFVFIDAIREDGRKLLQERSADKIFSDSPHDRLKIMGIKIYLDGALGSRGAHLLEDYSDDPGNRGLQLMDNDEILGYFHLAEKHKLAIAMHAIGDGANRRALNFIEKFRGEVPQATVTFRIEHAQIISDQDVPRFRELNVHAIIQPAFYTSDIKWAHVRIGPARMKHAYRWASLVRQGVSVIASSDAPIEQADFRGGISTLSNAQLRPEESVSFSQALDMYTTRPAQLSGIPCDFEIGSNAEFSILRNEEGIGRT